MRVDFHCHTIHSSDSLTRIPAIIQAARRIGLDKLVITDHNTIDGALEAFQLAPDLVIVGEEVKTTEGEFLAAFVTEPLPKKLEPFEALSRLKDQGAFISISHPFDPVRSGWSRETLERLAPHLDALEVLNGRMFRAEFNQQALAFAHQHNLPGVAGSDGHHPSEIGCVFTELPFFTDAESLREVVRSGQQHGKISTPFVRFYSLWAKIVKSSR